MGILEDIPDEYRRQVNEGVIFDGEAALLSYFLPPVVGAEVSAESDLREIPLEQLMRVAGIFACLGQQVDGYRVLDEKGAMVDTFLAADPKDMFSVENVQLLGDLITLRGCIRYRVPRRLGEQLQSYVEATGIHLSELMAAGHIDRMNVRNRQRKDVAIHMVKDGNLFDRVVCLT